MSIDELLSEHLASKKCLECWKTSPRVVKSKGRQCFFSPIVFMVFMVVGIPGHMSGLYEAPWF